MSKSLAAMGLLLVLVMLSCSSPGTNAGGDAGGDAESDAGGDAAGDDSVQGDDDTGATSIRIRGTEAELTTGFQATISGTAGPRISEISVSGNTGVVVLDGVSIPVVVYSEYYWPLADSQTFTMLGVESDRLSVYWVYCDLGGGLSVIWYETTSGDPVTYEFASGSCTKSESPVSTTLELPELELPIPELVDGFLVSGDGIEYSGTEPGQLEMGGSSWLAYPFNIVDCSTECGDPGAYELHSILWRPESSEGCFGIIYLWVPESGTVNVNESFCLPTLGSPTPAYSASYSH